MLLCGSNDCKIDGGGGGGIGCCNGFMLFLTLFFFWFAFSVASQRSHENPSTHTQTYQNIHDQNLHEIVHRTFRRFQIKMYEILYSTIY